VKAGPTIGASALRPKFVAVDTAALGTPRRSAPSQPLLDLSVHRVVSAEDLLCDNKIGCKPGRNPATRNDVNAQ
jgi:hypothetical protein